MSFSGWVIKMIKAFKLNTLMLLLLVRTYFCIILKSPIHFSCAEILAANLVNCNWHEFYLNSFSWVFFPEQVLAVTACQGIKPVKAFCIPHTIKKLQD